MLLWPTFAGKAELSVLGVVVYSNDLLFLVLLTVASSKGAIFEIRRGHILRLKVLEGLR